MLREVIEYEIKPEHVIDYLNTNNVEVNLKNIYKLIKSDYPDLGYFNSCELDEYSLMDTAQEILEYAKSKSDNN